MNEENLCNFTNNIKQKQILQPTAINDAVQNYTERIHSAAEENIKRTSGKLRQHKRTIWWDASCSRAVAERRIARKNLERNNHRES